MKQFFLHTAIVLILCVPTLPMFAQERLPIREYTNPDERITMSGDTKFAQAMDIFAGMFKRFGGKILVSEGQDQKPIGVNIPNMYWRDAFDMVLRVNKYWYDERENYIRVISVGETKPDTNSVDPEVAGTAHDVEISTIYFEASVSDMRSLGIDWSVLNIAPSDGINAGQTRIQVGGNGDDGLKASVGTFYKAANVTAALQAIQSSRVGEVISSPSIIVRSGEKGRIQIGSDVTVKQRDFAGNMLETFFSTGLITEVKPVVFQIDSVNVIKLEIGAERSSVLPDPTRTVIDRTKANTSVYLLDNEETIIGGLYTNDNKVIRKGIPFLKDLPWWVFGIRYLAGYDETAVDKKELIIILKARILPSLKDRITQRVSKGQTRELQEKLLRNEELYQRIHSQAESARTR